MTRGRQVRCPHCGGQTVSKGYRQTATMGVRKLRKCRACGRRFTVGKKAGKRPRKR